MLKKQFLVFILIFPLFCFSTVASSDGFPVTEEEANWELSEVAVSDSGETSESYQGTFLSGYAIRAKATSKGAIIPSGDFVLELSAFKPKQDMGHQRAGIWYLKGKWTITTMGVDEDSTKTRYTADVLGGDIDAELSSSPVGNQSNWSAKARLPMSLAAGAWSKGEGTLTFREGSSGSLNLAISRWPETFTGIYPVDDAPGRRTDRFGTVPNPGTQQQELANITFPAPYNVFEFVVTCAACHGGTIDQQAGHFGNWAGTSMASAARDPIFRANQVIVNNTIKGLTTEDGAGNMCFRCHSPNGWYSGRFDPSLAGVADGSTMIQSPLLSTDSQGIMCEFCHRTIGNVTMKRSDLNPADPVWNMLAGISDWPHAGGPFVDQDGSSTIAAGNPYGDTTLQINDGMTYIGKYTGSVDIFFADTPVAGTNYTGQTYGINPPGWENAGQPVINPDGSIPIHFEKPIGPPTDTTKTPPSEDYQAQAISLEHPTAGDRAANLLPQPVQPGNTFVRSPEFCGSCHDLTVPVLNNGMPEQRTYTEWKYSAYGDGDGVGDMRCQDCHMPTMKHEYSDDARVSLNPDPVLTGWFPYGKDRNPNGGTSFHKFAGANRDLPMIMTQLYPEVDLEVIGAPTGNDTRIFPGMLSDRSTMWDRTQRNTEISLLQGVDVEVVAQPRRIGRTMINSSPWFVGIWEVQVKVTNNSGHRIPSGYPDGRRFWINLEVSQGSSVVYNSGYYDEATAQLHTDRSGTSFNRATSNLIDARVQNQVMVYEKVTGSCTIDTVTEKPTSCSASPSLLNKYILFDNRIPPAGFTYADYQKSGAKFWNYESGTLVPFEDVARYPDGQNYDVVTYRFYGPLNASSVLNAKARVYWQTHSREFMEHLKDSINELPEGERGPRPEGPPSIYAINYPLTPNYLSDGIGLAAIEQQMKSEGFLAPTEALQDNWGGIAYAAWFTTGKGSPYLVAYDDSSVSAPPAAPGNVNATPLDPFSIQVSWDSVANADGYIVWVRYGVDEATASWDKLAVVYGLTQFTNEALNVGKTYGYKVEAFNSAGSNVSAVVSAKTVTDVPLAPENLMVAGTSSNSITLSWLDVADNETDFVIERQDVPVVGNFYQVAVVPSQTPGGAVGGNSWTDTGLQSSQCYNYRVAASNASGMSTWNVNGPIQGCAGGAPEGPITLSANAISGVQVDLTWSGATGTITGFRVERSLDGGITWPTVFNVNNSAATGYSDTTVQPNNTYSYRVTAYNLVGNSAPSNIVEVITPGQPPAPPTNLSATGVADSTAPNKVRVDLKWTDNSTNESGFIVERSLDGSAWTELGRTSAGVSTYTDTNVQAKSTYFYRVCSFNASGPSQFTAAEQVVTPGEVPQAPSDLRVIPGFGFWTFATMNISWVDNSTNEQGFYLERSTDGGSNWTRIRLSPNATSYRDWVSRRTTYWYRIQAYNADGVSEYSAIVSATSR